MAKADIIVQGRAYSDACGLISDAVGDIGEARVLLVTALALMDELDVAKRAGPPPPDIEVKATAALSDAAARIEALAQRIEEGG